MKNRLFLMADRTFVDKRSVKYEDLHWAQERPVPANVIFFDDKPWEAEHMLGSVITVKPGYYRMYYRSKHHGPQGMGECPCCAESYDGINWHKPELGLFLYEGSDRNNIIIGGDCQKYPATEKFTGWLNFETGMHWRGEMDPFIDPTCPEGAPDRYKVLLRGNRGKCQVLSECYDYGMYPAVSPDGYNWRVLTDKPVITKGKFDSINKALYDPVRKRYAAFVRDTKNGLQDTNDPEVWRGLVCRDVRVCFSSDFIHWTEPEYIKYTDFDFFQLYTNGINIYPPEPEYMIGLPTYFHEDTGQTEPSFMISCDGGVSFFRWPVGMIPISAPEERDGNRSNYFIHGMVFPNEDEIYVYALEGYYRSETHRIRRFVWRRDRFVFMRGTGSFKSRKLDWEGGELQLNYTGKVIVSSLDESGNKIASVVMQGDEIRGKAQLPPADQLLFELFDAKVYAVRL